MRNHERLRDEESVIDLEFHVASVLQIEVNVPDLHVRRLRIPLSGSREEAGHRRLLDGEETVVIANTGDTASGVIVLETQHFKRNNDLRTIHPLLSSYVINNVIEVDVRNRILNYMEQIEIPLLLRSHCFTLKQGRSFSNNSHNPVIGCCCS